MTCIYDHGQRARLLARQPLSVLFCNGGMRSESGNGNFGMRLIGHRLSMIPVSAVCFLFTTSLLSASPRCTVCLQF